MLLNLKCTPRPVLCFGLPLPYIRKLTSLNFGEFSFPTFDEIKFDKMFMTLKFTANKISIIEALMLSLITTK